MTVTCDYPSRRVRQGYTGIQAQEMPQSMSDNPDIPPSVYLPQGSTPSNPQLHSESGSKPRDNEPEKDNEKSPLSFTLASRQIKIGFGMRLNPAPHAVRTNIVPSILLQSHTKTAPQPSPDKTIEKPRFRGNPPGFRGNWRNPSHL